SPLSIQPKPTVYDAAVDYEVGKLGDALDRPARNARIVRHGLRFEIRPGREGTAFDPAAGRRTLVRALASFDRRPVKLPVRVKEPAVAAADLLPALRLAR